MKRRLTRDDEAACDAVFEQADALPVEPPDTGPVVIDPLPPASTSGLPTGKPTPGSPLRDYLRELKQEFDEQEDRGKL